MKTTLTFKFENEDGSLVTDEQFIQHYGMLLQALTDPKNRATIQAAIAKEREKPPTPVKKKRVSR